MESMEYRSMIHDDPTIHGPGLLVNLAWSNQISKKKPKTNCREELLLVTRFHQRFMRPVESHFHATCGTPANIRSMDIKSKHDLSLLLMLNVGNFLE